MSSSDGVRPVPIAQGTDYATGVAEQKTVTLDDGSSVEMNAQTHFRFVNGKVVLKSFDKPPEQK